MRELDAALDCGQTLSQPGDRASLCASAAPTGGQRTVESLPAERVLWWRGDVLALRRRGGSRTRTNG